MNSCDWPIYFYHNQAKLILINPLVSVFKKKIQIQAEKRWSENAWTTSRASHHRIKQKVETHTHILRFTLVCYLKYGSNIYISKDKTSRQNIYEITDNSICFMHLTRHSCSNRKNILCLKLKPEYITLNNTQN